MAKFGYVDTIDRKPGIFIYSFPLRTKQEILTGEKGSVFKLPSKAFNKLAFYANLDTTKAGKNNTSLYLYDISSKNLKEIVTTKTAGVPQDWIINDSDFVSFSQNCYLFCFGFFS